MRHATITPIPLDETLHVSTPLGRTMVADTVCRSCVIVINGHELVVDLILLDMKDFDVILGMDWLASYHATVNCYMKEVVSHTRLSLYSMEYPRVRSRVLSLPSKPVIYFVKVHKGIWLTWWMS